MQKRKKLYRVSKNEPLMKRNVKEENKKLKKSTANYDVIKFLPLLIIPISENCNAIYSKATVLSILFDSMLSKVSVAGTAYAQACAEKAKDGAKRSSCGEFFRQLFQRAIEYDFERMFTRIVRQQTSILKNTRWWPKVADVAIDIHYVTRYDTKKV